MVNRLHHMLGQLLADLARAEEPDAWQLLGALVVHHHIDAAQQLREVVSQLRELAGNLRHLTERVGALDLTLDALVAEVQALGGPQDEREPEEAALPGDEP